jgi:hypothetical protein
MFNIFPKVEKAKGKMTKQDIINEERIYYEARKKNTENQSSVLLPMVSTYLNHPGTKTKRDELKDVGIYEFMDSLQRIQIYESTVAINHGMYSGFCDLSKVDKNLFNFAREK